MMRNIREMQNLFAPKVIIIINGDPMIIHVVHEWIAGVINRVVILPGGGA